MADKDFVIKHGLVVGDTATINGVQIDPSGAISNQVLKFDGTKFTPASEGDISGTVYSTTIGDGTNSSYVITHGFGTRNVLVVIRNATSPYEVIQARWEATTTNTITVDFSSPVASETVTVSVYGAVTGISTGSSYYQTIGNGTDSSFTLAHNFNTRDVVVTARNAASPYEVINVRWEAETANTVIVDFSSPPSSNSIRIGVYATVSGTAVTTIDDLGDVTIASATNGQYLSWNGSSWVNANAPTQANLLAISSNVIPSVDNFYTLGNASLRWKSISIGGGTIYITDSGNNNQVALTISNGIFNIDGIAQAQLPNVAVTNLTFSDSTVQTTAYEGHTQQVKHLVKNDDSVTLTKGMVVYTSGANGTNILVKRAGANSEATSAQVLGFVEANIAVNGTGYIVNSGLVTNIDTSGATAAGDPMWLSATTAGGVVYGLNNKPEAPNHLVYLGVVTKKNANTGEAFVHISNGWELDELHNVSASTPSSGDFLKYNGSVWVNDTIDLGTDTTGNYVSSLVAGTGITLANNSGEGATPTVTVNTSVIAPLASPSLTGTPLAPTAANTTNNTQIATTAYVKTVINDLIGSAPATLDTLGEISASLANNASLSSSLTASIALKAPLADPTFTGTVTLPDNTVALGTKTTGDYVASLVAGTGITLSNNSGEGTTPTIAIGQSVATSATPTFASITTTGSNGLIVNYASGDEGGEMLLAKPVTNTSISGTGIVVDVYQNKLRFFEQGGSARGVFIDLTTSGAGVTSPIALSQSTGNSTSPVFSNLTVNGSLKITTALEIASISATAATGTINIDFLSNPVVYYTANATANWTLNIRGNSSTTMNTVMSTGDVATVTFMAQQGATAYYPTVYQIDGTAVTPKWQGGTAPTSGNASSIDTYAVTIVKTAANTYTAFASQTKFA